MIKTQINPETKIRESAKISPAQW